MGTCRSSTHSSAPVNIEFLLGEKAHNLFKKIIVSGELVRPCGPSWRVSILIVPGHQDSTVNGVCPPVVIMFHLLSSISCQAAHVL